MVAPRATTLEGNRSAWNDDAASNAAPSTVLQAQLPLCVSLLFSFRMMQVFLGMRTAFLMRSNTAATMLRNFHSPRRCFHSSLLLCERRHHRASSSPNTKKKKRKNNRKRSKAKRNRRAQELEASKQEWLPQDGDTSLAKTMPAETRTSLPLELWSKSKADATFFHGLDGLAVQWSSPSVQTSQHASVKAVLQDIQQSK